MAALTLRPLQRVRILETAAYCSRGGIGRRVRLRTVWGNPWRFESSREHLNWRNLRDGQGILHVCVWSALRFNSTAAIACRPRSVACDRPGFALAERR